MMVAQLEEQNGLLPLVRATLRLNTLLFAAILGLLNGLALVVLGILATLFPHSHAGLAVYLLAVFMPGYEVGALGTFVGFVWGFLLGACMGGAVYWMHARNVLAHAGKLVELDAPYADVPAASLRLHGPSLGIAFGALGAIGLVVATNWLVLRGTADASPRARLLGEVLPGYALDLSGSLVGGAELFVVLYLLACIFAFVYNHCATLLRPGR